MGGGLVRGSVYGGLLARIRLTGLRSFARRINALTGQKAAAKTHLHALNATSETPKAVLKDAKLAITQLEKRIDRLTATVLKTRQKGSFCPIALSRFLVSTDFVKKSKEYHGDLLWKNQNE